LRWTEDVWLRGSHGANVPPTSAVTLTVAHMKFTHDFRRKASAAMVWKSHARKGEKYVLYRDLLEKMNESNGQFLCAESERYAGSIHLEQAGLLKWTLG